MLFGLESLPGGQLEAPLFDYAPEILKCRWICQTQTAASGLQSLFTMNIFRFRIRWLLVAWMFVISAIAYLDRVNISIAGQFLQKELRLTDTQLGYVFSAFVFG